MQAVIGTYILTSADIFIMLSNLFYFECSSRKNTLYMNGFLFTKFNADSKD